MKIVPSTPLIPPTNVENDLKQLTPIDTVCHPPTTTYMLIQIQHITWCYDMLQAQFHYNMIRLRILMHGWYGTDSRHKIQMYSLAELFEMAKSNVWKFKGNFK